MNTGTTKQNIPKGWRKTSLESLSTKLKTGGTPTSTNKTFYGGSVPFVKIDDMTTSGKYLSKTLNSISDAGLENSSAWLVPKDSILYSIYATVGEVSINEVDVATNQAIMGIVVNEKEADRDYLYQYLLFIKSTLRKFFKETTQKNLTSQIVKELEVLIPNEKVEQKKIAEILSAVDDAIQKTDQIIQKTEKLKQGLMNELLTKGIGHKNFKKTKLGEIPEEWEVKTINQVAKISTGITPLRSNKKYYLGEIPWIKSNQVNFNEIHSSDETISKIAVSECHMKLIKPGAILIAMYGQGVTRGRCAVLEVEATTNQAIASLEANNVNNLFLYYYLQSKYEYLRSLGHGGNQLNLNTQIIGLIDIPVPTEIEQIRIVEVLVGLDKKISHEKQSKQRMGIIKKGLMQDIFSQKVEVN